MKIKKGLNICAYPFLSVMTLARIQRDIDSIKERNRRVEADKAWETSGARKIIVTLLTYFVVVLFFYFAGLPKPFANSIVPSVAFLLSTLTLDFFKKVWLKQIYK